MQLTWNIYSLCRMYVVHQLINGEKELLDADRALGFVAASVYSITTELNKKKKRLINRQGHFYRLPLIIVLHVTSKSYAT